MAWRAGKANGDPPSGNCLYFLRGKHKNATGGVPFPVVGCRFQVAGCMLQACDHKGCAWLAGLVLGLVTGLIGTDLHSGILVELGALNDGCSCQVG